MKKLFTLVVAALLVFSGVVAAQPDRRIPYRILPALPGAGVDQTALVSGCTVGQVLADDGAATDRFICTDMMGGSGGASTSDVVVRQIGSDVTNLVLPGSRNWVGTGITISAEVHLILLDTGLSTDDYHVIDWDTISADGAGVAGASSETSGEYETFIVTGITNSLVRIGHDGGNQILLANNITGSGNLTLQPSAGGENSRSLPVKLVLLVVLAPPALLERVLNIVQAGCRWQPSRGHSGRRRCPCSGPPESQTRYCGCRSGRR